MGLSMGLSMHTDGGYIGLFCQTACRPSARQSLPWCVRFSPLSVDTDMGLVVIGVRCVVCKGTLRLGADVCMVCEI